VYKEYLDAANETTVTHLVFRKMAEQEADKIKQDGNKNEECFVETGSKAVDSVKKEYS
jgi:hypothetical protein